MRNYSCNSKAQPMHFEMEDMVPMGLEDIASVFPIAGPVSVDGDGWYKWVTKKNPGWLGYIGDYTTQSYRDFNKPW